MKLLFFPNMQDIGGDSAKSAINPSASSQVPPADPCDWMVNDLTLWVYDLNGEQQSSCLYGNLLIRFLKKKLYF